MYETNVPATEYGSTYARQQDNVANEATSSPIRDGIGYAEQTLSELHQTISHLEKRLETVLSPVPPTVASQGNKAGPTGPPASHVHGRLVILNEGYAQAVRRLRDLAQRVEV